MPRACASASPSCGAGLVGGGDGGGHAVQQGGAGGIARGRLRRRDRPRRRCGRGERLQRVDAQHVRAASLSGSSNESPPEAAAVEGVQGRRRRGAAAGRAAPGPRVRRPMDGVVGNGQPDDVGERHGLFERQARRRGLRPRRARRARRPRRPCDRPRRSAASSVEPRRPSPTTHDRNDESSSFKPWALLGCSPPQDGGTAPATGLAHRVLFVARASALRAKPRQA